MGEFALDLGRNLESRMDFSSVCAIMCKLHAKTHSIFQIHTWQYHLAMRLILLQITDIYIDIELICSHCAPVPILEKYRQIQNSILDFLQPVGVIHQNHIRHVQQLCQLDECLPIRKNMVALMQSLSPQLPSYFRNVVFLLRKSLQAVGCLCLTKTFVDEIFREKIVFIKSF